MHMDLTKLQTRLDGYYDWPCGFTFKFIAPEGQLDALMDLFPDGTEVQTRQSRGGSYVSVTAELDMGGSDAVLDVYRQAAEIDGIISL